MNTLVVFLVLMIVILQMVVLLVVVPYMVEVFYLMVEVVSGVDGLWSCRWSGKVSCDGIGDDQNGGSGVIMV